MQVRRTICRNVGWMGMPRLTALKVKGLIQPGRYGDGDGLWFQVRGPEQRSWLFRFKVAGRERQMGLGPFPDVGLADAREAARQCRAQLRAGVDPLDARQKARADSQAASAVTFRQVAGRYIAAHEAGWRNPKHRQQWRNTLDAYVFPKIGNRPVASIETGAVTDLLEAIWREKPETASRVRGRIESILDFATARGWRSGDNPARWRGHLDKLLPAHSKVTTVKHHSALPWREIRSFMAEVDRQESPSALALQFLILTATRTGETIGATWGEIDLAEAIWTIPANRMKAGREHRVPLSTAAMAVLADAAKLRTSDTPATPIFPGAKDGKPLSNMALLMLLRRMERADLTAHGFRSTFRDWCAEATNHPRDVAEQALAHSLPDKVEAAYRRGDLLEKRRRLMEDWAAFCRGSTSAE